LNGSEAYASALRLLTGRGYSEAGLAERLRRKGCGEAEIAAALERCRELGYLDDARYGRDLAASLLRAGRAVGPRLLAELKRRGLPEETARAALEEASGEVNEEALLSEQLERRFSGFSYLEADERQRRRVVNFFLRRGFPLALILSTIKQER